MTTRWICIGFCITLLLQGCVRSTSVHDFGVTGPVPRHASVSPDAALRSTFRQQTKGAFSPLADDSRISTLQNRLKGDPQDVDARLELAAVFESYRLYDDALENYTAAFDRTASEKALMGIARCDQVLKRTWQAIPLIEQFLKEMPSAAVWNELGLLYGASGDLPAGEKALREAVAGNPAFDLWHNNLGYNLLLQNKTDAAEVEFRKALELNAKSVGTHNNLGIVLARRGDLEAALEQFQFSADAATAHNNLAVALMEAGKYEQSRDELVKSLALQRSFEPALANFKLVQERIRQRAETDKAERSRQRNVRVAAAEQDESPLK
jgi:tetratricopeptide (TPR) repeat protein